MVKKVFLDTNIFLRYFTRDSEDMYQATENILKLCEGGMLQIATSTIVLTEIIYTLKSFYKLGNSEIFKHLDSILRIKNIILIEKTYFNKSYQLLKKDPSAKISDCLIITQVPLNYLLCSFDKGIERLMGKGRFIDPGEI
ncbi:PIN domain-containing protein [Candidatus Gottesmanbacteria bacterium]|nr:PIN domain-containing protein [Candidatus Gottesmanbacteria bacterium]